MSTAPINPYLQGGLMAGDMVVDIIGLIMQKKAMDKAARDAEMIDRRNFAYMQSRDHVSDEFNQQQLKEAKQQAKAEQEMANKNFRLNSVQVGQDVYGKMLDRVANLLNTNTALRERTVQMWGI